MADFQALKRSGHFWDNTEGLPSLLADRGMRGSGFLLNNTAGKGGSTLLSLLRYYMDSTLADPALFADLAMAQDPHFEDFLGQYRVFSLDFSDFRCTAREDIGPYLYPKAEDLYRRNTDLFYPDFCLPLAEAAVDIHYRQLDPLSLAISFQQLVGSARRSGLKTLLLIDNAVLLEEPAEHMDWSMEEPWRQLLEALFPITLHDCCDTLVMANALPERKPSGSLRYTTWNFDLWSRAFDDRYDLPPAPHAVPPEHRYAIPDPLEPEPQPPAPFGSWDAFYAELKHRVDEENARLAREAASAAEKERQRYLLPPPADFPKVSPNIGARSFSVPTDTPQYRERNAFLQKLYRLRCVSSEALYEAMQNLDTERRTDLPPYSCFDYEPDPLQDALLAPAAALGWDSWPNHSYHWLQYSFHPPNQDDDARYREGPYVKTYLSFAGEAVREPFLKLARYLLQNAKKDFIIKVSPFVRDDMVCCWLRAWDLPVLKGYALQHAEALIQPLPFVPYWSGIGLSRELIHYCYNATVSNIAFAYFSTVPDAESVSLAEMLDRYVQDWNQYHGRQDWTKDDALAFLVVLDSFSVLLGDLQPEDSVLLTRDSSAYSILEQSRCWNDLEKSI